MSKLKVLKISQPTRPSIVSSNYSAKVKLSDLEGIDLNGLEDGRLLIYNANTGNFEAESADLNAFVDAYNKANAAFDQANTALAFTTTPSHVANSASAYANAAFIAANNGISLAQQAYNGSPTSNLINATQNTNIGYSWNHANSSFNHANAAFSIANSIFSGSTAVDATQNNSITAAFAKANNEAGVNATQNTSIEAAFAKANNEAGVNATQNTNISYSWNQANSSFEQANASFHHANAAFLIANSVSAYSNTVNNTQNTSIEAAFAIANSTAAYSNTVNNTQNTSIEAAFAAANTKVSKSGDTMTGDLKFGGGGGIFNMPTNQIAITANIDNDSSGFFAQATGISTVYANTDVTIQANTGGAVTSVWTFNNTGSLTFPDSTIQTTAFTGSAIDQVARNYANAAFASANNIDGINATQNTNIQFAWNHANASFNAANNVFPQIQPSFNTANAAFIRANNSLNANNGGTITGDLSISGNLSVLGNTFTISATTIVANDTVILLGANNYTSDLLDIGISAHYNDGVNAHTGFIRDHGTKEWQLFEGYTGEIGANNDINISDPSFKIATLNANLHTRLVKLNNQDLQTLINNAYNRANNSLNANTGGSISGNVIPTSDNTYYLGSETNRWHSLYVGPGSIDLGGLIIRNEGNVLTVSVGAGLPTPIAGSDEYARNHANAAFISANNISGIDLTQNNRIRYAENHANAAFISANDSSGIDLTQNNRITYSSNHANAAFISANNISGIDLTQNNRITYAEYHANAAFIFANTSVVNSYDAHGRFKISADAFGRYIMSSHPGQTNPGIYVEAGKTYAFELNIPFLGSGLTLRLNNRFGATVANVTHISTSGVITANSTADQLTGTLYWTVPSNVIGNTFVYCNSTTNSLSGRIEIINPALFQNTSDLANSTTLRTNSSFDHANSAFLHANAAFSAANSAGSLLVDSYARNHANAAFIAANTADTKATSAGVYANGAFLVANSAAAYSNTVDATQNTNIQFAWNHANGAFLVANSAAAYSNTVNNTQNTNISFAYNHANAAFIAANSAGGDTFARNQANAAFIQANNSFNHANSAFLAANGSIGTNDSQNTSIQFARNHANAAFNAANTAGGADTVARNTANASFNTANAAFSFANSVFANVAVVAYNYVASQGSEVFGWGALIGDGTYGGSYSGTGVGNADGNRSSPIQMNFGKGWVSFNETYEVSMHGIKYDGTLWSWGRNTDGTIGDGTTAPRSSPTQIGTLGGWKQVSGTDGSTAAIKYDGSLWTWGSNLYGMLGTNDAISRSSPVQVGSSTNQTSFTWTDISVGAGILGTMAGIKSDGTLWAWGSDNAGTLGISLGNIYRSSPTQIGANTFWQTVKVCRSGSGYGHVLALTRTRELWVWGSNYYGVLGINLPDAGGATNARSSPVQVGTDNTWAQISGCARPGVSAAIKTNGTLWTWGFNEYGQLGQNFAQAGLQGRSSPAQVGARTDWSKIIGGTVAIRKDGTIWSWGRNDNTSVGDNTTINRSSPVQLFATSNRSPGQWRTIAAVGTTPYSVTYAVRWSDQGVGSSAESLLIANNIVTGI